MELDSERIRGLVARRVAGETLKAAADAFSVVPLSTAQTRAQRPASPSLALR